MTETTRNVLVGLTVLTAVVILAGMIVGFQELPAFAQRGWRLELHFPNAGGADEGTDVLLAGRRVGRIVEARFTGGDARKGVTFVALIDPDVRVPGDVNAYIRPRGFTGNMYIDLVADGQPPGARRADPATGGPLKFLPTKDPPKIEGQIARAGMISEVSDELRETLGEIIPDDLGKDIRQTLANINQLTSTRPATAPSTMPGAASAPAEQANLYTTLSKLDQVLDAIIHTLGDKQNQENFSVSLANLRNATGEATKTLKQARDLFQQGKAAFEQVSTSAREVSGRFAALSDKLIADAETLGRTLNHLQSAAAKIDAGEGTAGKLINDPDLYKSLLDATRRLKETLGALQDLLEKWKAQGVDVKL